MRKIVFIVPEQYDGIPLRGFLRGFIHLSAHQTARLKRQAGGITRNGKPVIAPDLLHAGDRITLTFPDDDKTAEPVALEAPAVFEDADLLVLDKPAFMPMYPCPGHDRDSLANAAAYHQRASGEQSSFRPVYRLDRDTTGLVLLAKNSFAAAKLSGAVRKTYLAVCEGVLKGSGVINLPIGLKPGHSIQRAVVQSGIAAVTRWRAVKTGQNHSLVAIHLKTGRTHQIRVHFSAYGHPLAGDDMYGGSLDRIGRQALHCGEIRFRHPVTGERIRLRSPIPQDMMELAKQEKIF